MFALLRSFTTAGFGGSRAFEVLQWDESEDNQVFLTVSAVFNLLAEKIRKRILLYTDMLFCAVKDQCTTAPVDEYFDRYEMWHQPEYCDTGLGYATVGY